MKRAAFRIWTWPVVLGALTASGLVTALVSDAWGDVWSWISLVVPLAVIVLFVRRRNAALPSCSQQTR